MNKEMLKRIITGSLLGLIFGSVFLYSLKNGPIYFSFFLTIILAIILLYEMPRLLNYKKISSWILTLLYPILPFIFLIQLNQTSSKLVLLIFLIAFANDIGAYFIGYFFGKHKLCPKISPKKTIEGFLGGAIFIFVILKFLILQKFVCNSNSAKLILFSFIFAVIVTAGDLFESWLKRKAHIKDSGTLLPGHGGLLDRFDSILALATCMYIFNSYFQKLFCL